MKNSVLQRFTAEFNPKFKETLSKNREWGNEVSTGGNTIWRKIKH